MRAILFRDRATGLWLDTTTGTFTSTTPMDIMAARDTMSLVTSAVRSWQTNPKGTIQRVIAAGLTPDDIKEALASTEESEWREDNIHLRHQWDDAWLFTLAFLAQKHRQHDYAVHVPSLTEAQKGFLAEANPGYDFNNMKYFTVGEMDSTLVATMGVKLIKLEPYRDIDVEALRNKVNGEPDTRDGKKSIVFKDGLPVKSGDDDLSQ